MIHRIQYLSGRTLRDQAQTREQVEFSPALVRPPKFLKANLASARFDRSHYFTFTEPSDPDLEFSYATGARMAEFVLWQGSISDDFVFQESESKNSEAKPGKADPSREGKKQVDSGLDDFQRRMRGAFYMAELDHASLPENLSDFLKKSKPTLHDFLWTFKSSILSRDPDPDLDCTPKRN